MSNERLQRLSWQFNWLVSKLHPLGISYDVTFRHVISQFHHFNFYVEVHLIDFYFCKATYVFLFRKLVLIEVLLLYRSLKTMDTGRLSSFEKVCFSAWASTLKRQLNTILFQWTQLYKYVQASAGG